MNGNGCLEPSRNDFEQDCAIAPTAAAHPPLTLAEWLRVYRGLSSAADELHLPFDSGFTVGLNCRLLGQLS